MLESLHLSKLRVLLSVKYIYTNNILLEEFRQIHISCFKDDLKY